MQAVAVLTLLLVASCASAASNPSSQPDQQVANSNAVPVASQPQNGPVVGISSANMAAGPAIGGPGAEGIAPQTSNIEPAQRYNPAMASYYAPAGLITVVGGEQQNGMSGNKPMPAVRNFEQYGQPEPASIPPSYKPFGSWGLYIGGNPADGYYTNYYKALSNSVEKQQAGEQSGGPGAKPGQASAFNPIIRQAGSSPYGAGNEYYSFAYSPSEFNSAAPPVQVIAAQQSPPPPPSSVSPVQAGAQVYGSPAAFESNYGISPYADAYATKKLGAAYAQKEAAPAKEAGALPPPPAAAPPKGYQSRVYVYPPIGPMSAPGMAQAAGAGQPGSSNQQVVAYPVPVGSQIVGSQPGVDGSFNPYGVHAFTRYAIKPTMVSSSDPSYYYGVPMPNQMSNNAAYKPQQPYYASQPSGGAPYYSASYYGYPMNQLHYSQGSVGPAVYGGEPNYPGNPAGSPQVDSVSDKSDASDDKNVNKQQSKKA